MELGAAGREGDTSTSLQGVLLAAQAGLAWSAMRRADLEQDSDGSDGGAVGVEALPPEQARCCGRAALIFQRSPVLRTDRLY